MIAFYWLLRSLDLDHKTLFQSAISTTISYGGSTNANAAIVGGMIGALVGYQQIESISGRVLTFDQDSGEGIKRAEFTNTSKYLVKNISELIKNRAQSNQPLFILP